MVLNNSNPKAGKFYYKEVDLMNMKVVSMPLKNKKPFNIKI